MDFEQMIYIPNELWCAVYRSTEIMKHIHETWAFLVKSGIWGTSVYNVYMEARMSLSTVSQEHSFCACAVLGRMALYDGMPYLR